MQTLTAEERKEKEKEDQQKVEEYIQNLKRKIRKEEGIEPIVLANRDLNKNKPEDQYPNIKKYGDYLNRQGEHVRDIPDYINTNTNTTTPIPYRDIPQDGMMLERKVIKKKNTTFIYTVERPVQEDVLHVRRRIVSLEIVPNDEQTSNDTSIPNLTIKKKKSSVKKVLEPSPISKPVKSRKMVSTKTVKRKKVGIKASIARKTKTRIPVIVDDFKDPKKTANKIDDFIQRALRARERKAKKRVKPKPIKIKKKVIKTKIRPTKKIKKTTRTRAKPKTTKSRSRSRPKPKINMTNQEIDQLQKLLKKAKSLRLK